MKRVLTVCTVLGLALSLGPPAYSASLAGALVQVSSDSPFDADCGRNEPGTVFDDSELEPFVAVNPADPANLVGASQQDRWDNGGSRGTVSYVSDDGGLTWETVPVPGVSDCTGGPFVRATDPWVTISPDGTAYVMSLVLDNVPPANRPGGFGRNAMVVNRSTDGGHSWGSPTTLRFDDNPRVLNDKNSMTADPGDSLRVYATWDRLIVPNGSVIQPEHAIGLGFSSPAYFTRTTDGGQSWEPARKIYTPAANNQTIGNQILVLPDGTLLDFFNEIVNFKNSDGGAQFESNFALIRSSNQGVTWTKGPALRAAKIQSLGVTTPDGGQVVRDANILFDVAVAPNGTLYGVWQDARFTGLDSIALTRSTDGGRTWSAPVRVNKTPTANPRRSQAFVPSVDVNRQGDVAVSYYDFRNDVANAPASNGPELADHFLVTCPGTANCADPNSFGGEVRVTNASFDITKAPNARGFFLGDYVGLANDGTNFFPFFAAPTATDPDNIFVREVAP